MSSLTLSFDVVGDNRLESIFDHLALIPEDFRPAFEEMAEDFWEHEREVFDSEGPGWRPLSDSYEKWKQKHYPGQPILVRTGALRASLTGGFAEDSVFDVRPKSMEIGTSSPYAIFHQTGSVRVEDHPPKRTEMTLPDSLQTKWNRRMVNWLREEINYRG